MAKNNKVGHFRGNNSYKGLPYNFIQMKTFDELDLLIISAMTLSICNYKKIYICIVVAQDFQVSNSGSWEPLVLEPPWNPPWIHAWITVKNRSLLITGIHLW
jgi:hypothetical protein